MSADAQDLIDSIGTMVEYAFDRSAFRDLAASINRDTYEVVFDIDLVNNSRGSQHDVIRTMMDTVYPIFEKDDVSFTFIFSEHEEARARAEAQFELAVV
ncbi:hypothetical protein [Brachybacterium huguangmaarense]